MCPGPVPEPEGKGKCAGLTSQEKDGEGFLLWQLLRLLHLNFTNVHLTSFPWIAGGCGENHMMLSSAHTWRLLPCRPWVLSHNPHILLPQCILITDVPSHDLRWIALGFQPLLYVHCFCHDSRLDPLSLELLLQPPATPQPILLPTTRAIFLIGTSDLVNPIVKTFQWLLITIRAQGKHFGVAFRAFVVWLNLALHQHKNAQLNVNFGYTTNNFLV